MRAIDLHVHAPRDPSLPGPDEKARRRAEQQRQYFRATTARPTTIEQYAEKFEKLDVVACIFNIDNETTTGEPPGTNDYIAGLVRKYPNRFMGFGAVDPNKGKIAINEVERCVKELGFKGLKFWSNGGDWAPNDLRFYPLWEKCQELGVICLFHSGHCGVGSGLPGGGGIKMKYSNPIPYFDDIGADFPELKILMAHPSWPWTAEQLSVLVHKANVYAELSGWSPKYFDEQLVQYCNSRVQDKVMFSSDYPALDPERWLKDFEERGFREEVKPKILLENAKRLLNIK